MAKTMSFTSQVLIYSLFGLLCVHCFKSGVLGNNHGPFNFTCPQWYCKNYGKIKANLSPQRAYGYYDLMGCACDNVCSFFGDCCPDFSPSISQRNYPSWLNEKSKDYFSCLKINYISTLDHVYIINKCPDSWPVTKYKRLCNVNEDVEGDWFLDIPVTGAKSGVLYRNIYCAACNQEEYIAWSAHISCYGNENVAISEVSLSEMVQNPACTVKYEPPFGYSLQYRPCPPAVISTCRYPDRVSQRVKTECTRQRNITLVHRFYYSFKNQYCAMCFVGNMNFVKCEKHLGTPSISLPSQPYSYSILLDLNTGLAHTKVGQKTATKSMYQQDVCEDDAIFDPFTCSCREVTCPDGMKYQNKSCTATEFKHNLTSSKCPLVKLNKSEFEMNSTHINLFQSKLIISKTNIYIILSESDVYVCADALNVSSFLETKTLFSYSRAQSIVSACGMCVSIITLTITASLYIAARKTHSIPDKNIMSLILALFLANSLLLFGALATPVPMLCKIMAFCTHYGFLAVFSWMNVMALDMWITFSSGLHAQERSSKRYVFYNIFGWFFPGIIVATCLALDFLQPGNMVSPSYGETVCWINSKYSLLLFFVIPLAAILLINLVLFVLTARNIYLTKQMSETYDSNGSKHRNMIIINLKLTIIIGLTWSVGFVTMFCSSEIVTFIFIIINSLQGFFVGISCLFSGKFRQLVSEKCAVFSRTGMKISFHAARRARAHTEGRMENECATRKKLSTSSTSSTSATTSQSETPTITSTITATDQESNAGL
ncbi:uncharacterized protein LOC131957808 [Physella acuta]|uniref:uncharacterized protein LOC131957808 n=1 Tax=Physella acuta TaxID=109671 RepID=UPI0027DCFE00|nr:uncharacterized protein LOC131957808 [Physella acuta]